jgi:transcriptional regulator with XRE-family HTH domain
MEVPPLPKATETHVLNANHIGSTLESFLEEEGIPEDVTTEATLRILAWQIERDLAAQHASNAEFARRMNTNRPQIDRLLRADGTDIKLSTLENVARALNRKLRIELV